MRRPSGSASLCSMQYAALPGSVPFRSPVYHKLLKKEVSVSIELCDVIVGFKKKGQKNTPERVDILNCPK